jgi:hypothetical protein
MMALAQQTIADRAENQPKDGEEDPKDAPTEDAPDAPEDGGGQQ